MTINSQVRTAGPYAGDGTTRAFPFSFKVFQDIDLLVAQTDTSLDQTPLVLSSDYTVTLNADQNSAPGGYVNLTVAPPSGYVLNLTSNVDLTQGLSLPNGGPWFPKNVEDAFDRQTILSQQLAAELTHTLQVPEIGGVPQLPSAAARAGNLLGFDSSGDPVAVIPGPSGDATSLALQLLSTNQAANGAGQIGFNYALRYPAGTVGYWLQGAQGVAGAGLFGYGANSTYAPGTVGRRLQSTRSITDAPYLCTGTGDETAKIQQCATDLQPGEVMLIPNGNFNFTELTFTGKFRFALCVQGTLTNIATKPGVAGEDCRSTSASGAQTIKFDTCLNFRIHGAGSTQNGFREALFFTSSKYFDCELDCIGNGTNDNLPGIYLRYCDHFYFGRMTVDGVTLRPANDATEVYTNQSNNFQVWDCYDFSIDGVTSRNAGMNGIYAGSNCYDFSILDCTLEMNAASGVQLAWSMFGQFPQRFNISNNRFRVNQADGLDINNTSGTNVDIYAAIHGNIHLYNGWLNGSISNSAGSDGSGIGTFRNVNRWCATNNQAYECANAGISITNCNNWSCTDGTIFKSLAGTLNDGVYVSGGTSGRLSGMDVNVPPTLNALNMQSFTDLVIHDNAFDGMMSFANGSYDGCKFSMNRVTTYVQVLAQFDWLDNVMTVTGSGVNALYNIAARVIRGNDITSDGASLTNSAVDNTRIVDNKLTCTGTHEALISTNSDGVLISGNKASAQSAAAIRVTGTSDQTTLIANYAISVTGNSFLVDTTVTNSLRMQNKVGGGSVAWGGSWAGVNT